MDDLIERQAAIDALKEHRALYCDNTPDTFSKLSYAEKSRVDELDTAIATLVNLPSAQPEIIRCNDCKHWTQTTGNMRGFGLGDCDYINAKLVNCNGFCYWAERREE
jgi:hypothetical protein